MINDLLLNAALLVVLSTLYGVLARIKGINELWIKITMGFLCGAVAVAGMNMPMSYAPGVIYDGRSIVLSVAGLFGGWTVGCIAGAIAAMYRFYLGGVGTIPGIATIISSVLIGILFLHRMHGRPEKLGILGLFLMGIVTDIAMLLWSFILLPSPMGFKVITQITPAFIVIFPTATVFIGLLMGTDRRRHWAEKTLREREEWFRRIFHTSPDAITITRVENAEYVDVNAGFTVFSGYERDEVIGRSATDIQIWCDPKDRQRLVAKLAQNGKVDNFEVAFRRKDGFTMVGLLSGCLFDLNGEQLILLVTRHIDHLKQLEREREQLFNETEAARKLLSSVFARISDGVTGVDNKLNFTYVNEKAAKMLGHKNPEELLGRYIGAEFPAGVFSPLHNVYQKALNTQHKITLEEYYPPSDSWFESRIYPAPEGLTVYLTDVTKKSGQSRICAELKSLLKNLLRLLMLLFYNWICRVG
ncbi:MAG: PAS domain S-box protein [Desulfuromonas sp.]|nr:PAS domain S-box protein [Desulfuromonas sp.]